MKAAAAAILLASLVLAGCADPSVPDPEPVSDPSCAVDETACNGPVPHVVVADIDSGINVYHERFRAERPLDPAFLASLVDSRTGRPPVWVNLTWEGTYEERFEADRDVWSRLERGVLYYFAGTRVLGIGFDARTQNVILDGPDGSHGTATAGAVFDHNPEAVLVMVEGVGDPQAEAWVAEQPWIDIVTMSYGPPGSVPGSGTAMGLQTHMATKQMWRAGMVPVGAADNTPALAPNDETAGPPWVLGVAGDHPETSCREHLSGTLPDYTADFTQELPTADSVDGRRRTSGTSFSTPTVAGVASKVLLEVRKAWDHTGTGAVEVQQDDARTYRVLAHQSERTGPGMGLVRNVDLREALNRTASYFGFGECQGTGVNPAAPWLQQGWGHVGPETVNATVAHLLGIEEAPRKPETARTFMEANMAYRRQLWGFLP
ncbi:MAG TPA: S8/S53 family peptidase [Candidatus Thermoplasmatota archaeon]|nr:S8/S53 family peptidase [Candidatus Thermoplasmatota archaeon]